MLILACLRLYSLKKPERLAKNYLNIIDAELLNFQFFRENPVPAEYYDIKKLKGYRDTYRARIGDLRVIYEIVWNQRRIHVLVIKPRESAYS